MTLSIVVPTHDTRELTLRCLGACVAAGASEPDIVVVDDGSTDGTAAAIAKQFPGAIILTNPVARGFTAAANQGAARAAGELLLLLNSDTEVAAEGLRALAAAFEADPQLGVAGAALLNPDGSPQWSGGAEPTTLWLFVLASGFAGVLPRWLRGSRIGAEAKRAPATLWVTGAALALRRELWGNLGGFDPEYRLYAQDLDLCSRARAAGWRIEILPAFRVLHHHGATISAESGAAARQNPEKLWRDLLTWARKHRSARTAARARLALRLGGSLRLLARAIASPWQRDRSRWQSETAAYRAALTAIRR